MAGGVPSGQAWIALAAWLACGGLAVSAHAAGAAVPVALQARLLAKIASYEGTFKARAGDEARILVVAPSGGGGERDAGEMKAALEGVTDFGGLPARAELVTVATLDGVPQLCRERQIAVVYLAPGFAAAQVKAMAAALAGVAVLTASGDPAAVPSGAVVGFDLVSGRPKILINLAQAKGQGLALASGLLSLAKVYP